MQLTIVCNNTDILVNCWFQEMLVALRNNGELESFSSVLVIGQRGFCGSLNWREIQSKNKSVIGQLHPPSYGLPTTCMAICRPR